MGLLNFFRRRAVDRDTVPTRPPMVMEAEHWELRGVDFCRFFQALSAIAPADALLVLADGSPSSELRGFYGEHARHPQEAVVKALSREFRDGVFLPVTPPLMAALAALAGHHASPEVAIHVAVTGAHGAVLEWFDAVDDPVSIATCVEEEAIRRFAEATGATYRRRPSVRK